MMNLKARLYLLALPFLMLAIASCNPNKADLPVAVPQAGKVSFFNLIPANNFNSLDFYINGTRQNTNKISYADNSGYMSIASGPQAVLFKLDSLRTDLFPEVQTTIQTDSSTFYVTTRTADGLIYARDTALVDSKNYKPKFRFINASADAPAFDLTLNTVSIANTKYKSISAFVRVDTGKVALKIFVTGSSKTVVNTTFTFSSNKVYTFFVYGSYTGSSGGGFNLGIIANH